MAYHNPEIPGSSYKTEEELEKAKKSKVEPKKPITKDKAE